MVQQIEETGIHNDQPIFLSSWSPCIVHIRTTITGLDTPIIPFAVLKENPLHSLEDHLASIEPQTETSTELESAIINAWNTPFTGLGPEKHFFLCAWSSIPRISPRVVQTAGLFVGVATPGVPPTYARYVTTQAVQRQGRWVAWCIPVEMLQDEPAKNRVIEIELGEENMMQVTSLNKDGRPSRSSILG